jgi:hypothetical protein
LGWKAIPAKAYACVTTLMLVAQEELLAHCCCRRVSDEGLGIGIVMLQVLLNSGDRFGDALVMRRRIQAHVVPTWGVEA